MKLKLQRCFTGVEIGGVCTGTVHFFRLDAKQLQQNKIIETVNGEYLFKGLPRKDESSAV